MNECILVDRNNGNLLASQLWTADTFFARLKGLLGRKMFQTGQALMIKPCNSIHTIGMAYPIDVLFMAEKWEVLKVAANLQPNSFSFCWGSAIVIELPSGVAVRQGVKAGHQLLRLTRKGSHNESALSL